MILELDSIVCVHKERATTHIKPKAFYLNTTKSELDAKFIISIEHVTEYVKIQIQTSYN